MTTKSAGPSNIAPLKYPRWAYNSFGAPQTADRVFAPYRIGRDGKPRVQVRR